MKIANFKVKQIGKDQNSVIVVKEELMIIHKAASENIERIGEPSRYTEAESPIAEEVSDDDLVSAA